MFFSRMIIILSFFAVTESSFGMLLILDGATKKIMKQGSFLFNEEQLKRAHVQLAQDRLLVSNEENVSAKLSEAIKKQMDKNGKIESAQSLISLDMSPSDLPRQTPHYFSYHRYDP
jgi:hypothetical protein